MNILKSYFRNLFAIAISISLVWRNFFHWNLSKIAIYGSALLASILSSAIPGGLAVYLFRSFISSLDTAKLGEFVDSGNIPSELLAQVISSWGTLLAIILLVLCVIALCLFFFAYAYFLLAKVHDSYLIWEKLPIRKNLYLSWSHIRRYFSITAWVSWYLLIPVLTWMLGIALMAAFQIFSGIQVSNTGSASSIVIGGIYILITLLAGLWFIRIAIRCSFWVFLLLEEGNMQETGKSLVFKSFALTKGKIWKIIFLAAPFLLILGGIQSGMNSLQDSLAKNRSFVYLDSVRSESSTGFTNDFEFLSGFYQESLSDEESVEILRIQSRFEEKTDGIRAAYFDALYPYLDSTKTDPYNTSSSAFFYIIYFLLLEWVQAMIYLAIFRNTVSSLSTWEVSGVRNR